MKTREAINKIYEDQEDFVIIGLTGRTGSGCTTVADILKEPKFEKLKLRTPKNYDFKDSEEIKYSILYKYVNEPKNKWQPFQVISISNIIASYIFEKGYEEFLNYLASTLKKTDAEEKIIESLSALKTEINQIKEDLDSIDYEKIVDCKLYNTFIDGIPPIASRLKKILAVHIIRDNEKDAQLYTYVFQKIGNNIRASGDPFESEFKPKKIFALAERTNTLIKEIRKINKTKNKHTLICIDAIRNPFEATFFKERYSAFYLISVNTDDVSRRKRLSKLGADEILSLDKTEYPKKLEREEIFYKQNILACLEISDIHIYNPDRKNFNYYFLTRQLLKYVILMRHPGLVTPSHIERCMQIAYNVKLNSGCLSRQVGAVVTGDDYSIKSVGWNEVPKGQVSCNLRDIKQYLENKDKESYSNYEITDCEFSDTIEKVYDKIEYQELNGRNHPYCFKDIYNGMKRQKNQVYTRALHAEENAFLQISKYGGIGVKGSFLFTTASPCELCAKKAYQLGIKRIYYIDPYPGISQSHVLKFGSIDNPEMHLFYGAIGNAYIALYTSKISFKDELEMLIGVNPKEIIERNNRKRTLKK